MTTHHGDFVLNRPGALIAALPAVLGFVPEHSLVLASVEDGQLGLVMRTDLGEELPDRLGQLADAAATAVPEAVIAVFVDADGAGCPVCNQEYRDLCHVLARLLDRHGIVLRAGHVVDRIAAGGRWQCVDGCGAGGTVDDPASSPLAVAAVLEGRQLFSRRDDLLAVVTTRDPQHCARLAELVADHLPVRAAAHAEDPDGCARREVEAALAAADRVAAGEDLDDPALVALACAVADVRVRDSLFGLAVGRGSGAAESLWAQLSQRLPEPARVEALVLLAFSAYVRGDGSMAGMALEAALRCQPTHRMAGMLDRALQAGMRPEKIRDLAVTGYRLAAALGVRLPPRRFSPRTGRRAR